MTRVLLVRHATGSHVGMRLAGREADVHLSEEGVAQCRALAPQIVAYTPTAVYCSPLTRAVETATLLATPLRVTVEVLPGMNEMDVGAWTGTAIAALDASASPEWTHFNSYRSGTPASGGEMQVEVQARAARTLHTLHTRHPDGTVLVISHAEVIRATLGHVLGIPVDLQHRLAIEPASVSIIELQPWEARVHAINLRHTGAT